MDPGLCPLRAYVPGRDGFLAVDTFIARDVLMAIDMHATLIRKENTLPSVFAAEVHGASSFFVRRLGRALRRTSLTSGFSCSWPLGPRGA